MKEKAAASVSLLDLNSPQAVEQFRKAAAAFTARATRSQSTARQALIDEGIYTKAGKLTKRYS